MAGDLTSQAGELLLSAHHTGVGVEPDMPAPQSRADAYGIQDHVLGRLGSAIAWKIGRAANDPEPYIAPIPKLGIVRPDGRCVLPPGAAQLGVEAELGMRLGKEITPEMATLGRAECLALFSHVVPLLEILHTRLAGANAAAPLWKLADFQASGGVVLGAPVAWTGQNLASVQVMVNGEAREARHPFGDPLELLHWAVRHLARRGGAPTGTVLTTGSYTGITQVGAGERFEAEFSRFGEVRTQVISPGH